MFKKLMVPLPVLFLYVVAILVVALLAWDYVYNGAGLNNPALAVVVASIMGYSCRLVMAEVSE